MADADLTPLQSKSKPGRESNERKWPGNLPKISLLLTLLFFFFAFCLEIKSFHRLPLHTDLDVPNHDNVLQKHVAFFDRNHDGLVYPWETFQGFRAIGANLFLSTVSAFFINIGLSSKTRPNKFPSPFFPIVVKNIHLGKHGSDSGVYDSEGRFAPSKFEEIFKKHSRTHPNALTEEELKGMLKANREPKDFMGWFASFTEWKTLYNLCKDKNGLLQKETIKAVYDGSLFKQMEEERASSKLKK